MVRVLIPVLGAVLLTAGPAQAATWSEITSGPFHVISQTNGKAPRLRLAELDQMRYTLGAMIGKDDPDLVWPIELVLFANQREYAPQAPARLLVDGPLVDGPDATLAAWMADTALPHDLLRAVAQRLIHDNALRMPDAIEQGLADLMATVEIGKNNRVSFGAAPAEGELPEPRMRAWAKLQMLATQPEFSSKLRIYLNNLQQGGDEDVASQNAFGITAAELDKRAAQYYEAGHFAAVPATGPPANPDRDFDATHPDDQEMKGLIAGLKSDGKDFPEDSPRGLLEKRTKAALEEAAKANPRWAEPHDRIAALLGDPAARVKELKTATSLEPRNPDYWQDLAVAQEDVFSYGEADKAWKMAERNAANAKDKARFHAEMIALDQRQTQAAMEERRAKVVATNEDVERVKKEAEARLHAAEKQTGAVAPGTKVLPWRDDEAGVKLSGTLTEVECQKGDVLRLTVQPAEGPPVKLMIPDLQDLSVKGAEHVEFACGAQKPPKPMTLIHDGKRDAQQGSIGNVRVVALP